MATKRAMSAAEQFFHQHAGYSYDPKTETQAQGRRKTAERLAKAEAFATERMFRFEWKTDDCIGCECGGSDCLCCAHAPHETWCCVMYASGNLLDSHPMTSLGGICEPTPEYMRVIRAELALEVMP